MFHTIKDKCLLHSNRSEAVKWVAFLQNILYLGKNDSCTRRTASNKDIWIPAFTVTLYAYGELVQAMFLTLKLKFLK